MQPAEHDMTGKLVFITGAGIGNGIAQVLAHSGCAVR